jgi:ABC-type glycerol-3-phosphate transport system permease component
MHTLSLHDALPISLYQGEFTFPWPIISAALIVAIVPIAILIALFQERVVGGYLAQGGPQAGRKQQTVPVFVLLVAG